MKRKYKIGWILFFYSIIMNFKSTTLSSKYKKKTTKKHGILLYAIMDISLFYFIVISFKQKREMENDCFNQCTYR